jgi:hypothetical protein
VDFGERHMQEGSVAEDHVEQWLEPLIGQDERLLACDALAVVFQSPVDNRAGDCIRGNSLEGE